MNDSPVHSASSTSAVISHTPTDDAERSAPSPNVSSGETTYIDDGKVELERKKSTDGLQDMFSKTAQTALANNESIRKSGQSATNVALNSTHEELSEELEADAVLAKRTAEDAASGMPDDASSPDQQTFDAKEPPCEVRSSIQRRHCR